MSSTAESARDSIEAESPPPRRAKKSAGLSGVVVRSLREGALWVFGALALILLVALLTYDRNDPSFQTTGEAGPVNNLIGPIGAQIAGLLVMLFGRPAYLFPIMIGLAGWVLFSNVIQGWLFNDRAAHPLDKQRRHILRTMALAPTQCPACLLMVCPYVTAQPQPYDTDASHRDETHECPNCHRGLVFHLGIIAGQQWYTLANPVEPTS